MLHRILAITSVLAFGLGAAACVAPTFSLGGKTAIAAEYASSASGHGVNTGEVVASVNAYRRSYGLQPVRADAALTRAARAQSAAMAQQGVMSHDAGGDFRARLLANGVGRAAAVENIAWGTRSFAETMQMWQSSSKHAENMQTPDMTRVGVAVVNGANGAYWTMVMAGNAR